MGHLLSDKSSLIPLIDRLNRYPIGLVDSAKLREILSLLFSEEEAFVASRFPLHEATCDELCELTGIAIDQLLPILESMASKGLVMDLPYSGATYYLLVPGLIGFFEFTFMRRSPILASPVSPAELARLMSEYLHENGRQGQTGEFFGSPTRGMGFRISTAVGQLDMALVWAEILLAALAGTAFYGIVALIERRVTFWHPAQRG